MGNMAHQIFSFFLSFFFNFWLNDLVSDDRSFARNKTLYIWRNVMAKRARTWYWTNERIMSKQSILDSTPISMSVPPCLSLQVRVCECVCVCVCILYYKCKFNSNLDCIPIRIWTYFFFAAQAVTANNDWNICSRIRSVHCVFAIIGSIRSMMG